MPYEAKNPRKTIDTETLYDLTLRGMTKRDMAAELGVSTPTLSSRIADLQKKQGLLLQYRALQNLQLTELQSRCLEAITPEKIEEAPLRDLVFAYKVLKDKELVDTGKPTELRGIMHYLIQLEKEELAAATPVDKDYEDADFEEANKEDLTKYTPKL
jgi:DNA-binding Lrp family transcriptional regulator